MPLIKGKIRLVNTQELPITAGFIASDIPDGNYAADSLNPNLSNSSGSTTVWGYDGVKYLSNDSSTNWLAKSKVKTRDHEVTVNNGMGAIFLRVDDTGKGWFLLFDYNTGNARVGICLDANTAGCTQGAMGQFGEMPDPVLTGFYQAPSATTTITFGCKGFEFYIKLNGVETDRFRSEHHCKPGTAGVKMQAISASFLRTFTYQSFTRTFTYSNTNTNTADIRDFGAVPNAKTTGSISALSYDLTVADASKFPVGCTVIVATGGEASWMGRTGIGTIGVGGVYPNLHYPDVVTMQADRSKPDGLRCFVDDTGLQYVNNVSDNTWYPSSYPYDVGGFTEIANAYDQYCVQVALRAKIISKTGNVLTLDKAAAVGSINAWVYYDSSYAISRLLVTPAQTYFKLHYPQSLFSDMSQVAVPGRKVYMPAGEYYVGEDIIFSAPDIEWFGDGNDQTILIAPQGASSFNVFGEGPSRSIARDFKCIGNTRTDTYSGRWDSWYGNTHDAITSQYSGIASDAGYIPWGFGYISADDIIARNITFVDIWWLACGTKQNSQRAYRKNIRVERTAPLLKYIQWHFQDPTGCDDGIFEECHFDSDWIHPAFEAFDCNGTQFIRCTMRNGIQSFNNAGQYVSDGCTQLFDGTQPRPAWQHPNGPATNLNTNIGANKYGGLIKNHSIIVTGYQDTQTNHITGIVINSGNADITLQNVTFNGLAKATGSGYGPRAFISTGQNITVEGFIALGTIPGDNFYDCNFALQNGIMKRVNAPTIYITSAVTLGTGAEANTGTITVV